MNKIPYAKQIQTFATQIDILKQRGLIIEDETKAEAWLSQVSYYRMSGYWYPLLADRHNHLFKPGSTFTQACCLYDFDSQLRHLVMAAIERIEIAVRTRVAYVMSQADDGFWIERPECFSDADKHRKTLANIYEEYHRSDEQFVRAFKKKYNNPLPPSWVLLEITSFGTLSLLYQNLIPGHPKRDIAAAFGVSDTVFESWLHTLVYIRNICAHHARLWNRTLGIRPLMPRRPRHIFIGQPASGTQRMYFVLSVIRYLLNIIDPGNTMPQMLSELFSNYRTVSPSALGFPSSGWEHEPLWQ